MAEQRKIYLQPSKREKRDIEFDNISYTVKNRKGTKQILNGLSGMFKSGELTVIMGPSGAGKSSLLNILSGFQKNGTSGMIRCTGQEVKSADTVSYSKDSCYILQEDTLCPLFTVWETMMFAAKLKLGTSIPPDSRHWLLSSILETLGLSETIHTRCNRLSGGQRKRLSIALELIDNPPIMFLDEPTTGLDSLSSFQCVSVLKELAHDGRTIICTIHQPSASIFEMFDHVYIIGDGQCLYQGTALNTIPFLASVGLDCPQYHNPADHMLEVANGEYGDFNDVLIKVTRESNWRNKPPRNKLHLVQQTSRSHLMTNEERTMVLVQKPSEFYRFKVLLIRNIIQLYRDWTIFHLRCVLHVLVGVFIGLLYYDYGNDGSKAIKNVGYFIISIVYLSYTTMMPAALKLPSEVPILRKESFNNWFKLSTYYSSFVMVHIPIQIIFSVLYVVSSYFLTGQALEMERLGKIMIIMILSTLVAESFGVILGTSVNPISTFYLKVLVHILVSTMLGVFYYEVGKDAGRLINNVGFIGIFCTYLAYTSMLPAVLRLPAEVLFIRRENFNNYYYLSTYYAMYIANNVPQQIFFASTSTVISYTMTGQPLVMYRFFIFLFGGIMVNIVSDTIGQIIGTIFKASNGTFIAGVMSAYFILLAGFLIVVKQSAVAAYLTYTSYHRYGLHMLITATLGFNRGNLPCMAEYCHYNTDSFLEEYSLNSHPLLVDIIYLFITYLVTSFIGYFTLKVVIKNK